MRRHRADAGPLDPREDYAPEIDNIGPLSFMSRIPGGTQASALAQALGAYTRGDASSVGDSYAYHLRRNANALRQFGGEVGEGWTAAGAIPGMIFGPKTGAIIDSTASLTRGESLPEAALAAALNGPTAGPMGPYAVGNVPVAAAPVVYRGAAHPSEAFGRWWSDNPDAASAYAKLRAEDLADAAPVVSRMDVEPKRPLEIDAQGAGWDEVPWVDPSDPRVAQGLDPDRAFWRTDALARLAEQRGHDALVIKNVADYPQEQTVYYLIDKALRGGR